MRRAAILAAAAAAAISLSTSALAAEPPYNLTAAGGSPTGLLATLNAGVDAALAAAFPGSTMTYQTSGGGFANIALINQKRVPLGYVVEAEVALAMQGRPPFKGKIDSLRTIAYLAGGVPMHNTVTKAFAEKYGLKNLKDLAAKKPPIRIALQQRGNVVSAISEDMFQKAGFTVKDVESWGGQVLYVGGAEFAPLMSDGRIDMMSNMTALGGRTAEAVARAQPLMMLDVDKPIIDSLAKELGIATFTIPKSLYTWLDEDYYTNAIGIVLVGHKDMDDKTAYNLAKAFVEQLEKFQAINVAHKSVSKEYLASFKLGEYHPGAARYYKEAGLMK